MKKPFKVAILLIFTLAFSTLTMLVQPSKASTVDSPFSDHFEGNAINSTKWVAQANLNSSGYPAYGGSITVTNSSVYLTSNMGSSFPCVYSAVNPFPLSGDFALEFDVTYTQITGTGSGLWVSSGPFKAVTGMPYGEIFQVWADTIETWGSGVKVFLFGNSIYHLQPNWNPPQNNSIPGVWDTYPFLFRLSYSKGTYTVTLNGTIIGQAQSDLRPDFIAFGHPPCSWVPRPFAQSTWTSFKIDSIRMLQPSSISLSTSASTTNLGFSLNINGSLRNWHSEPINDSRVVLSYEIPGTSDWNTITSVVPRNDSSYSATWIPTATGTFLIKAAWAGDGIYAGTNDVKNVSVMYNPNENLFFAESNSTLTALSFNATSREISFTVSGLSGTTGYVRFLISDTLLKNLTDFRVYMDGQETSFTANTFGNMQSLYFQYNHSKHEVLIKLPSSPVPELSGWVLLPLFAVLVVYALLAKKKVK